MKIQTINGTHSCPVKNGAYTDYWGGCLKCKHLGEEYDRFLNSRRDIIIEFECEYEDSNI